MLWRGRNALTFGRGCLWRLSQKDDKDKCRFIYTTKPDTMCQACSLLISGVYIFI